MAMKTLRESQATSEENNFMHAYSNMLVEVEKMNTELINNAGRVSSEVYDKKEKRIEDLRECLILFNKCFFNMMYYKQEMVTWKKKSLDKELEFVNFVTKSLDNESSRK
ncbi:hypothetical protein [uncultured Mediterranean phage uvMED]|nr:hypothetical protein [uncultured Mediterranean phage uvMED]